jgi:hypothetical protein
MTRIDAIALFAFVSGGLIWIGISMHKTEAKAAPVECPDPSAIDANLERVEALERTIEQMRSDMVDVATLAVIGGPKRRFTGGVTCDGLGYLPGSHGARASRALRASGMCETPGMAESVATK